MQPDKFVYELPEGVEIVVKRDGKVFLMLPDYEVGFGSNEHEITETSLGQLLSRHHQQPAPRQSSSGVH